MDEHESALRRRIELPRRQPGEEGGEDVQGDAGVAARHLPPFARSGQPAPESIPKSKPGWVAEPSDRWPVTGAVDDPAANPGAGPPDDLAGSPGEDGTRSSPEPAAEPDGQPPSVGGGDIFESAAAAAGVPGDTGGSAEERIEEPFEDPSLPG